MKKLLTTILALAAMALFAGPQQEAELAKIQAHLANRGDSPWTWVFYGDSITHGAVHTHGWRCFAEIFQERVRTEYGRPMDVIINSGNSGQTSMNLVNEQQYDWQVRHHKPQVVFLLIGCNDIVRANNGGPEGFRQRLSTLVERIRQDGAIPVLQTYNTIQLVENPTSDYLKGYVKRYNEFPEYNQIIRDVAAKYDTILVDHRKHWEENASDPAELDFWLGETIHPGAYGHQQMAILITKALGMYDAKSKCLTLAAGGLRKKPAAAPSASDIKWVVDYKASRDGAFSQDKWKVGYKPAYISLEDDFVVLDHDDPQNLYAMIGLKDASFLAGAKAVVTEITLRIPPVPTADPSKPSRLFLGITAEREGQIGEMIILFSEKSIGGSIPGTKLPKPLDETHTLRFELDVEGGFVTCYEDGTLFATVNSKVMSKLKGRVDIGDGGSVIVGQVAISSLKIGVVK